MHAKGTVNQDIKKWRLLHSAAAIISLSCSTGKTLLLLSSPLSAVTCSLDATDPHSGTCLSSPGEEKRRKNRSNQLLASLSIGAV